jgi:hypothetical protein
VKQTHFTEQSIDWEYMLDKFAEPSPVSFDEAPFRDRMQFLVMCGMSDHVEALPFKIWRNCISNMIHTANFPCNMDGTVILHRIQAKAAHFQDEYPRLLKEITSILELALWKLMMNHYNIPQEEARHSQKK